MLNNVVKQFRALMTHPQGQILASQILLTPAPIDGSLEKKRGQTLFALFSAVRNDRRIPFEPWIKEWSTKGSKYMPVMAGFDFDSVVKTITPDGRPVLVIPLDQGALILFTFTAGQPHIGYSVPLHLPEPNGRLVDSKAYGSILQRLAEDLQVNTTASKLYPCSNFEDPMMDAEVIDTTKLNYLTAQFEKISLESHPTFKEKTLYSVVEGGDVKFVAAFEDELFVILQPSSNGVLLAKGSEKALSTFRIGNDCIIGHAQMAEILVYYGKRILLPYLNFKQESTSSPRGVGRKIRHYGIGAVGKVADAAHASGLLKRW